jgi:opacity protein-like surface antigen
MVTFRKWLLVMPLLLAAPTIKMASAQVVWAGIKAGAEFNRVRIDGASLKDTIKIDPAAGFHVGLVASFKVKNRYFLHTEYLYSVKNKVILGKIDPHLKDKVTYHYLEVPILFTMQFKGHLGGERTFKWFMGAGPNVAYLLGGRGVIESSELKENDISSLSYKIKFSERQNRDHNNEIHYTKVNRFQFGINVGAGLLLEPAPKRKVIVDLRYTIDQTLFGKKKADYIIPHDYDDNLRVRNQGLKFSVMYLLEYNLSKRERNKGKSNKKV